jgi:hypothetical protein
VLESGGMTFQVPREKNDPSRTIARFLSQNFKTGMTSWLLEMLLTGFSIQLAASQTGHYLQL